MSSRSGTWLSNGWLVTGASAAALALLSLLLSSPWDRQATGGGGPLVLYCSAGMTRPVRELLKDYEKEFGVRVQTAYDGSGKLLSEIKIKDGRGDLYLAAEAEHIVLAKKLGLIAEVLPMGHLRPVLAVSEATYQSLEKRGKPVTGLKDLLRDDLRVVLANPELASIGKMSENVLEKAGLWQSVYARMRDGSARVSTVGTVNDVAQKIQIGERVAGIVWSATAADFGLHQVPVPEMADLVEPLQLAVLAKSQGPTAALQLARFLCAADRGAVVLKKYHFEPVPDGDLWELRPTLHLSAGAMLKPGIDEAVKAFARREGVTIQTTYDGCGVLVSQMRTIKAGDSQSHFPDAYFACDLSFLTDVQPWFEAGTLVARNQIVLVVAKGNPLNVKSLADLTRGDLRVGLAHPTKSALGKLTDQLLRKLALHDAVENRPRPVVPAYAAHLLVNQMRTGALDVAVVYRSNVLSSEASREHLEIVELDLAEAIATQPFAVAKNSPHKYLMRRLLQALVAPENARRFQSLGFQWIGQAP
jgi:molybdate transport system substrate-binding protein